MDMKGNSLSIYDMVSERMRGPKQNSLRILGDRASRTEVRELGMAGSSQENIFGF
jgi:hypothetical protein